MSPRPHISLKTKLAAALFAYGAIPYEDAKAMSADQIISLFAFDHYPIRKADGGPDEPWNLVPRFIPAHREKTSKVDVPEMAKSKRIRAKQAVHTARMSTDSWGDVDRAIGWLGRKRKIPSRPFPSNKRKLRSNIPRN